ncbi:MAG: nucleotidyltransferase family protein [Bacillota bacterium]
MKANAVVMAGRANEGRLKEVSDAAYEALIAIAGRPMLDWVLGALRASSTIQRIVIVGPEKVIREKVDPQGATFVEPGESMVENMLRGVRSLPSDEMVLVVSSDLPLLTGHVIDNYLGQCAERKADLYYPIIEKDVIEPKYPGVHRTYATLREGTYTGGNVLLVHPRLLLENYQKAEAFVDARKSPLKLAQVLGFGFVVRLLLKMLSIKELEETICRNFNLSGVAVACREAEIGIDVDKPSDYELAARVLGQNRPGA